MWEDPIVAEVHRIRQELAAKFNYDIEAMFNDIRERQAALGDLLVPAPKKEKQVSESDPGHASAEPSPTKSAPAA